MDRIVNKNIYLEKQQMRHLRTTDPKVVGFFCWFFFFFFFFFFIIFFFYNLLKDAISGIKCVILLFSHLLVINNQ